MILGRMGANRCRLLLASKGCRGRKCLGQGPGGLDKEQQIQERIERCEYLHDLLKLGDVPKSLGVVEE